MLIFGTFWEPHKLFLVRGQGRALPRGSSQEAGGTPATDFAHTWRRHQPYTRRWEWAARDLHYSRAQRVSASPTNSKWHGTLCQLAWCPWSWVQPVSMARERVGDGVFWGAEWPLPRRPDPEPGGQRPGQAKPWGPRLGLWRGGGSGWGWQWLEHLEFPFPKTSSLQGWGQGGGGLKKKIGCHCIALPDSFCTPLPRFL